MKLEIKTRLSESDIAKAVYSFMDSHPDDFQHQMIPYVTRQLLPQFVKMPEVKAWILSHALYAMQEGEDMSFDLLMEAISETVEYDYAASINSYMVAWFKDINEQQRDESYHRYSGRI